MKKLKKEIFQKITLSQFTENEDDDFLLSRLSAREGQLFEVTPVKACPLSESQHAALSLFSSSEIEEEMKQQGLSLAMINIKESQLKQKLRFRTWYDLLKRKYQVKFKSAEFKP